MRVALLSTDNRAHFRDYEATVPGFGAAPEALLQGFAGLPELEVHVISCTQRFLKSPQKLADNIFYHSLVVPKIGWLRTLYQGCIRAVRGKLTDLQPDIVHGQGTERECGISAAFSGFPNVITIHGNMAQMAQLFGASIGSYRWLAARLENFALRKTAGVFCNSAYTESLVRPRAQRSWRVPNALRLPFFTSPPAARTNSRTLLCVGAIIPRKRQNEILEMAGESWNRGCVFDLHFIGRADPGDAYAAAFLEKLVDPRFAQAKYLGEKSTPEILDAFDHAAGLIHFPSEEAFGLVVAEALARNLKFFGANLGGVKDIADGVESAELFGLNDWTGLAAAVDRWASSGYKGGENSAATMRTRYHPEVIARRHLQIYSEVLGTGSK